MSIDLDALSKMSKEDQERALHFSARILTEHAAKVGGVSPDEIKRRQQVDRNNTGLKDPTRTASNFNELNELRPK